MAALLLPVAAGAETRLLLCLEPGPGDVAAAATLDGWVNSAAIELTPPPCLPPTGGDYVGRFEVQGSSVYFRLMGSAGPTLGRAVPWLIDVEAPLASLEAAGWIGEFSVVLEALLAEHHLTLEWAEILEAEVANAPADPAPTQTPKSLPGDPAGARSRRSSAKAAPDSARARGADRSPAPRPPAGEGRGDNAPAAALPGDGRSDNVPAAALPGAGRSDTTSVAALPHDVPSEPDPGATGPAWPDEEPRLPGIEEVARADAAEREARRNAIDFKAPDTSSIGLGVSAGGALRLRSPDIAAPEIALGFEIGPLYARGAWQPQVEWSLADFAVGVEAIAAEAGLHLPLLSGRLWGLRGHLGVAVERLVLSPLYRSDASQSVDWDAGPTAGATLGWRPAANLVVGLAGGLQWMPTARLTHIGELGPSTRVNAVGGRLGFDFSWRR